MSKPPSACLGHGYDVHTNTTTNIKQQMANITEQQRVQRWAATRMSSEGMSSEGMNEDNRLPKICHTDYML